MAKYKAKLVKINADQQENATAKIPAGTWYINACFKMTHKYNNDYDTWEELATDDSILMSKKYFLSHDIVRDTERHGQRTQYQMSRFFMNKDLGLPEDATDDKLDELVGIEREIISEENDRGYPEIKYINGPKTRKPVVETSKKSEFASIFNR